MPRSVLAQQYQSKTKNLSKQSVRSIYNVENQINTINNNAKKRNRQRSKSPHNRRKAAKNPEDEELDMNALAEYVEELKEYMHGVVAMVPSVVVQKVILIVIEVFVPLLQLH